VSEEVCLQCGRNTRYNKCICPSVKNISVGKKYTQKFTGIVYEICVISKGEIYTLDQECNEKIFNMEDFYETFVERA
jgi:hypothetical protein